MARVDRPVATEPIMHLMVELRVPEEGKYREFDGTLREVKTFANVGGSAAPVPAADAAQVLQQGSADRRVVRLAGREAEGDGRSSICGNHMNLGGPAAARTSDGLGAVFFKAPVPSGWTLTIVLSSDTASILMRTICASCKRSNSRSSTPLFDQRFMRV